MKKIVIAGTSVYGIENMGDEALLAVLVRELHNNISDLEITWLARHPDKELASLYNIQKVIKNFDHDSKEQSIGRWFLGLNPGDSGTNLRGIREALEECDLLIVGGDPFNEISLGVYRGLAPQAALLITFAKFMQKPVVLYSIHMGRPLRTDIGKELTKFCVTNSNLITLREEFSKQVLGQMNIPTDNTVVLSDSAWGLDPFANTVEAEKILAEEGIKFKHDKIVGFNFRHQYWVWNEKEWDDYCEILSNICDFMIEQYGVDILFIPNCTYDIDSKFHKYQDDRPTHQDIVQKMKNKNCAHQVIKKHNLFETLSLFSLLDMHFSNRRHSLVFGAIHGVPPVACGGEWHVKPAMEELGLGDYFTQIEDMNYDKLKKNFDYIWENRASIKENILKLTPGLREKAIEQGKVIADIIK